MNLRKLIVLWIVVALFGGCSDAWDDHTSLNKDVSTATVFQYLEGDAQYSQFVGLLKETGLDKDLSSPLLFTVFAPNNEAMGKVPAGHLSSAESKVLFVKHHITVGSLSFIDVKTPRRITMLNSKVLDLDPVNKNIDGIALGSHGSVVFNGVVYKLTDPVLPRLTIWEYIETMAPDNKHVRYINSLTKLTFDKEASEQIGFQGGLPIYDSVFVYRNEFKDKVTDLAAEDSTFTFFIVEDAVFDSEFTKFNRYYRRYSDKVLPADARDSTIIKMAIIRDYVFTTAYAPDQVPAYLVSPANVKVNFNPSAVVSSFKGSNGYVYVLSSAPVELADRIQTIIVEGEQEERYYGYGVDWEFARGYLRIKPKASGGKDFVVDNHNATASRKMMNGLMLSAGDLPTARYRVYWRAINDFSTSYRYPSGNILRQRLGTVKPVRRNEAGRVIEFGSPITGSINATFLPVELTEYSDDPLQDEFFVGIFNNMTYEEVFLQLVPEGITTGAMGVTVDYIKLVPEFN